MCSNFTNDSCSAWSETVYRARKLHVCSCCGGAIDRGQFYTRIFFVSRESATAERECGDCTTMIAAFQAAHGMRWSPGAMSEALVECIDEEGADSEAGRRWEAELQAMAARRYARKARTA